MPSLGQNGGAMNDSLAQHLAQTPSPSTGSRQATQSVGSAMSSASRAVCAQAPRQGFSAPRKRPVMEGEGDASAPMGARLTSGYAALKRETRRPDCQKQGDRRTNLHGQEQRKNYSRAHPVRPCL